MKLAELKKLAEQATPTVTDSRLNEIVESLKVGTACMSCIKDENELFVHTDHSDPEEPIKVTELITRAKIGLQTLALIARIEKLEAALKFYASKNSWGGPSPWRTIEHTDVNMFNKRQYGGKRAREALEGE